MVTDDAGTTCATKVPYAGALKEAIVGCGYGCTMWYTWVLYIAGGVAALIVIIKLWPLVATKIPKGIPGAAGGGGDGLVADSSSSIYG